MNYSLCHIVSDCHKKEGWYFDVETSHGYVSFGPYASKEAADEDAKVLLS